MVTRPARGTAGRVSERWFAVGYSKRNQSLMRSIGPMEAALVVAIAVLVFWPGRGQVSMREIFEHPVGESGALPFLVIAAAVYAVVIGVVVLAGY